MNKERSQQRRCLAGCPEAYQNAVAALPPRDARRPESRRAITVSSAKRRQEWRERTGANRRHHATRFVRRLAERDDCDGVRTFVMQRLRETGQGQLALLFEHYLMEHTIPPRSSRILVSSFAETTLPRRSRPISKPAEGLCSSNRSRCGLRIIRSSSRRFMRR